MKKMMMTMKILRMKRRLIDSVRMMKTVPLGQCGGREGAKERVRSEGEVRWGRGCGVLWCGVGWGWSLANGCGQPCLCPQPPTESQGTF